MVPNFLCVHVFCVGVLNNLNEVQHENPLFFQCLSKQWQNTNCVCVGNIRHCVCFSFVFSDALRDKEKIKWGRRGEINDKYFGESSSWKQNCEPSFLSEVYSKHDMIRLINVQDRHESLSQAGNVVTAFVCILPLFEVWYLSEQITWPVAQYSLELCQHSYPL